MSKAELRKITQSLKDKRAEISRTLLQREEIAIQQVPDAIDQTQLTAERELAITRLARDHSMLQSLDAALHRLENGTYGLCLNCEEEISAKRLQAVPWTSFCLSCQEDVDQRQKRALSNGSADSELMIRA